MFISQDGKRLPACTAPLNELDASNSVLLTFDDQKNAVRGETIGHTKNGQNFFCPHAALLRRVRHLRKHHARPETPLYTYFYSETNQMGTISTTTITAALKRAATKVLSTTGINPQRISAYSLRSGGATALLCGQVDPTLITLVGRWRSDAMLRYLRVQASSITHNHSSVMHNHGNFTFTPTTIQTAHSTPPLIRDVIQAELLH